MKPRKPKKKKMPEVKTFYADTPTMWAYRYVLKAKTQEEALEQVKNYLMRQTKQMNIRITEAK